MKQKMKFYYLGDNKIPYIKPISDKLLMLFYYITDGVLGIKGTKEVLEIIKDIESGSLEEYDTDYGNECRAVIRKDGVSIDLYHDMDNPVTYPLAVFKKALEEWLDFLETGRERIVKFEDF